jgi:Protein of unknown function (DUF742)
MSSANDSSQRRGEDADISLVRPYLLTAGRAQPIDQSLEIEAQVVANHPAAAAAQLAFERRDIVALCREPKSVAEVASILGLHIGVARVLVADLAELGYVAVTRPVAQHPHDVDLIERVIRGLESIA